MNSQEIIKVICERDFKLLRTSYVPMGEYLHFAYIGTDSISEEKINEMFEFSHCGSLHFNSEKKEFYFVISNGSEVKRVQH